MKHLLLLTLFISTSVSAIDFQKVTGTFDVTTPTQKNLGEDTVAQAAHGTFELNDQSRAPASVTEEVKKSPGHVTEMTGTFE